MPTTLIDRIVLEIAHAIYEESEDLALSDLSESALSPLREAAENTVAMVYSCADELLQDHSFICDDCGRRVSGEPIDLGVKLLCPGCMNYQILSFEAIRMGFSGYYDEDYFQA